MKLEGGILDLLTKLDPKMYRKYVTNEKVRTILYMGLLKSLYGTLQVALFLEILTPILQDWGYEVSPIQLVCCEQDSWWGGVMAVVWNVDDLKIFHKNRDIVSAIINQLSK